jgi:hypothetical protein
MDLGIFDKSYLGKLVRFKVDKKSSGTKEKIGRIIGMCVRGRNPFLIIIYDREIGRAHV